MTWLLTWIAAEPLEVTAWAVAGLCALVAVGCAVKLGRTWAALLREAEAREDWTSEQTERRW